MFSQTTFNAMINTTINKISLFIIIFLFLPFAHAHGVEGGGFINGLIHPVFGPDHLLAMVAVGILSVQIGGKAIWAVPGAFVALMVVGGLMGMKELPFPAIETGIALSVLVLGVAIAFDKKLPVLWSMVFVGFFAIFHGYAHGFEMPVVAQPLLYALGFVIATAGLHIAGVLIGLIARYIRRGESLLRYLGAGIAGIGFSILVGL